MPHLHLFRAALVSALFLLAAPPADAQVQVGRVGGIVRSESGEAIKGATVTAQNPDSGVSITATTDDRGRFSIIGLRTGQWQFTAEAPGYARESGEMPVRTAGAPNPPITFALQRSGPGASAALGNVATETLQEQLSEADALFDQGQWDAAIDAYQDILSRTPALNAINLQIASAHRRRGNHDAALAAYQALLRAHPGDEKARIGIAMTHAERGDLPAAERLLSAAASEPTAGRETFYSLADVLVSLGRASDAVASYQRAAEADRSWGKPLYRLGELAIERGDRAAATRYLNEVVAVAPVSPEAEMARAALSTLNR